MSDPTAVAARHSLPPPAPPLPPGRLGQLQRIIAPLGFGIGSRPHDHRAHGSGGHSGRRTSSFREHDSPSQTAAHRTGIPIAALDINPQKTHAILAGKEILKTVRIQDGKVTEDFNLRSSIVSYYSTHGSPAEVVSRRREYLPARDVKWSMGIYDHVIATAGTNGRISIYDVKAAGPRIELAWLHEHNGQVNKLDFDPFAGYLLLSASQDKTVRLWDIREPKQSRCRQRFDVRNGARDVRWSPAEGNDFDFAVCADGGVIQNWDARNPSEPKISINGHEKACYSIDWHPDGRHVVSGGFDKYIKVWDFKSDNKRQKAVFQCRAPQAIRNVRWRPPFWSAEVAESGTWQSTQIATSYHQEDPRIHVWDLRRPMLPFRELDRYNSPANDLLWASKDLLWTVGDEGMFTQTDVRLAPQVQARIAPCALEWMPDGECAMFFEERGYPGSSRREEAAIGFLSVPQEKLSSGDDGNLSKSATDEDEIGDESISMSMSRKHQSRGNTSRSSKSQANTPPGADVIPPIASLRKAVFDRDDLFNNYQVGAIGLISGVAEDPSVVQYLTSNYARVSREEERKKTPQEILQRLEKVFTQNADACDEVSLHRMAQSWRILGAVIVPELRDWADKNRRIRQEEAKKKEGKRDSLQSLLQKSKASMYSNAGSRGLDAKPQRMINSLFKGIIEAERGGSNVDQENTSNMTTPQAKPLPDSPRPIHKDFGSPDRFETIDNIQPLPPSLFVSHTTAAAASRALRDGGSTTSDSMPSSPELNRHPQKNPAREQNFGNDSPLLSIGSRPQTGNSASDHTQRQTKVPQVQNQEERRAALRHYKAQARPIFTLEEPVRSPRYDRVERDSVGSFPMFSASTDSSSKGLSPGLSSDSPETRSKSSGEDSWKHGIISEEVNSPVPGQGSRDRNSSTPSGQSIENISGDILPNVVLDETTDFSFGLDSSSSSKKRRFSPQEKKTRSEAIEEDFLDKSLPNESAVSSSPEMFQFDIMHSPPKNQIHTVNPLLTNRVNTSIRNIHEITTDIPLADVTIDRMATEDYIYSDFRPIDFSIYETRLPFGWSSFPLICQCIAFDMENGVAHAQFATHLLMHISPYFFHESFRNVKSTGGLLTDNVAQRLLRADLSYRIIEGVFSNHTRYLQRMRLFDSLAEVRKVCADLGYPRVASSLTELREESSLNSGNPNLVASKCATCQAPMSGGQNMCDRCQTSRSMCPICLAFDYQSSDQSQIQLRQPCRLWAYCQACGHGAHSACMQEWFSHEYSDGSCPSAGCQCDCAPGVTRQQRIEDQVKSVEENKLIRGRQPHSVARRDPLQLRPSPAVDKTRNALRNSDERRVHSGDERTFSEQRVGSQPNSGFGNQQRKSVRLVTPGEVTSPVKL